MAKRKNLTSFTIRLDTEFTNLITARGRLGKRSRCAEVERLLEVAVSYELEQEKKFPGTIFNQAIGNPKS